LAEFNQAKSKVAEIKKKQKDGANRRLSEELKRGKQTIPEIVPETQKSEQYDCAT
jgi:hypothetical protein